MRGGERREGTSPLGTTRHRRAAPLQQATAQAATAQLSSLQLGQNAPVQPHCQSPILGVVPVPQHEGALRGIDVGGWVISACEVVGEDEISLGAGA